jgi:hypothetical protein
MRERVDREARRVKVARQRVPEGERRSAPPSPSHRCATSPSLSRDAGEGSLSPPPLVIARAIITSPAMRERVDREARRVKVARQRVPEGERRSAPPSPSHRCATGPSLSRDAGEGVFLPPLIIARAEIPSPAMRERVDRAARRVRVDPGESRGRWRRANVAPRRPHPPIAARRAPPSPALRARGLHPYRRW